MTYSNETSPRAVLFDLDDTLLDRHPAYEATFRIFYDLQPAINSSANWEDAMQFFWSLSPNGTTDAQKAALDIMSRWPSVELDPVRHEEWFFNTLASEASLLPGVSGLLESLNDYCMPWGVVTNGKEFQITKLECSGLVEVVPFAIVSRLFGVDKPHPRIYLEAVRRLTLSFEGIDDLEPSEVLFVGDNPYTDITGAVNVGMKTAWIKVRDQYPSDAPEPDMMIDSVTDLREMLLGVKQ